MERVIVATTSDGNVYQVRIHEALLYLHSSYLCLSCLIEHRLAQKYGCRCTVVHWHEPGWRERMACDLALALQPVAETFNYCAETK